MDRDQVRSGRRTEVIGRTIKQRAKLAVIVDKARKIEPTHSY